jgi:starch-binding outer membrane protein, SusD/RagB family
MKKYILAILCFVVAILSISACKKYLDAKPDKSLSVPTTLNDLQALLDNGSLMNESAPTYDEVSSDNLYIPDLLFNSLSEVLRNAYTWENYDYVYPNDWSLIYNVVSKSNIVLNQIEEIEKNSHNIAQWNNIKGSALVFRAQAYLKAAWIFSKAYDPDTAVEDYGIVLRTSPDFNIPSTRANVEETYKKIIFDLKEAIPLLPDLPNHVMRPSKAAAFGFLARTYLSMRNYDSAYKYSNLCLQLNFNLIDYNALPNINSSQPFETFDKNPEVIMQFSVSQFYYPLDNYFARVDTILYHSYSDNDLRKTAFFESSSPDYTFKGSYQGSVTKPFTGLATDEMYLVRAECNARLQNKDAALADLNELLSKRWDSTFVPLTAATEGEALILILTERRKELLFRGLRWIDIKRLNKDGANIIIIRKIGSQEYKLLPNENRYALPLPKDIVDIAGIPQNPI